jgi:GNAT superfamily N-acetyltransferase
MVELTLKVRPTQTEVNRVMRGLVGYNRSAFPDPIKFTPVGIFINDPATGKISGGLAGHGAYDWMFVQYLFVPEELRGHGVGRAVMQRAEEWARTEGLIGIWLDTFDFQARPFYEKLGFSVFGTIDDHPVGGKRYFMRKRFEAPTA